MTKRLRMCRGCWPVPHNEPAHGHYTRATNCAVCECPRFRPVRFARLRRLVRRRARTREAA